MRNGCLAPGSLTFGNPVLGKPQADINGHALIFSGNATVKLGEPR